MQLLERVGIPEQANKYPAQLSGFNSSASPCPRPRHATQIMLFDEPTSATRSGDDQRSAGRDEGISAVGHDNAGGDARNGLRPRGGGPLHLHGRRRNRRDGNAPGDGLWLYNARTKLFLEKISSAGMQRYGTTATSSAVSQQASAPSPGAEGSCTLAIERQQLRVVQTAQFRQPVFRRHNLITVAPKWCTEIAKAARSPIASALGVKQRPLA